MRREPDPLKHCDHCGGQLRRKRFSGRLEDLGVFKLRRYCDRACMAAAFDGAPRTLTPASRTLRERARKIKGLGPCEECGAEVEVDVHHRDGNLENNALENLDRLCRRCHLNRHRGEHGRWGAPSRDAIAFVKEHSAMSPSDAETWREKDVARAVTVHDAHRQDSPSAVVAAPLTAGSHSPGSSPPGRRLEDDYNVVEGEQGALSWSHLSNGGANEELAATVDTSGGGGQIILPGAAESCEEGATCWFDPLPDGHRYAACGDGVASPVAHWIGLRLGAVIRGEDPDGAA